MSFLFIDYTNLVLKAYEEKRDANQLSHLLMHPTAANIKQECINVYTERLERGERIEESTLRAFFGILPEGKDYGNLIEWHPLGKFKSMQKLLKKEVQSPSSANVELLAWLIDFKPRPLSQAEIVFRNKNGTINPISQIADNNDEKFGQLSQGETDFKAIPPDVTTNGSESILQETTSETPTKTEEHPITVSGLGPDIRKGRLKIAVTTSLVLATLLGGSYIAGKISRNSNNDCMYWAGDHYEPVSCNEKGKGLLIPIDQEKVKSFRRITRKDTITEWSIGKLYYIKNNNDIECYTESGNYPLDIKRSLRKLTQYMYDRYLRKNTTTAADSSAESQIKSLTNR